MENENYVKKLCQIYKLRDRALHFLGRIGERVISDYDLVLKLKLKGEQDSNVIEKINALEKKVDLETAFLEMFVKRLEIFLEERDENFRTIRRVLDEEQVHILNFRKQVDDYLMKMRACKTRLPEGL